MHLSKFDQIYSISGTLRKVQRIIYRSNSAPGQGIRWEWDCDGKWIAYDIPTSEIIEKNSMVRSNVLDLSSTPVGIPNVLHFSPTMRQINKHTGFQRRVQRLTGQKYPSASSTLNVTTKASPRKGASASTGFNGHIASSHAKTLKTTVTSKVPKAASTARSMKKFKVGEHSQGTVFILTLLFPAVSIISNFSL